MTQSTLSGHAMATQDSPGLYASTLNALKILDPEAAISADSGSTVPSSFMITGDPLFKEGETSYYESRRIAKKLKETESLFFRHRTIHIVIICLVFVLSTSGLYVFAKLMEQCNNMNIPTPDYCVSSNHKTFLIGSFINPVIMIAFLFFFIPMMINIFCIVYICCKAGHCSKSKRHMVNIYIFSNCILLFHMSVVTLYIVSLVCFIIGYVGYHEANKVEPWTLFFRVVYGVGLSGVLLYIVIGLVIIPIIKRRCVTVECIFWDILSTLKAAYHYCSSRQKC